MVTNFRILLAREIYDEVIDICNYFDLDICDFYVNNSHGNLYKDYDANINLYLSFEFKNGAYAVFVFYHDHIFNEYSSINQARISLINNTFKLYYVDFGSLKFKNIIFNGLRTIKFCERNEVISKSAEIS